MTYGVRKEIVLRIYTISTTIGHHVYRRSDNKGEGQKLVAAKDLWRGNLDFEKNLDEYGTLGENAGSLIR